VTEAVITFMAQAGCDPRYGRRVVADMAAAGLSDVRGEGRALVIDSHSPGFAFFRLSFESLRDAVVGAGLLSRADADDDRRDRPPLSRSRLLCAPTGGRLRRGCRLTDHA